MASSFSLSKTLILFLFFIFISLTNSQPPSSSSRPHSILLPVTKDPSTKQYLTQIYQRTPQIPINLVLDLGGQYPWVECDNAYVSSSSYRPTLCLTPQCPPSLSISCGDCSPGSKPGCGRNESCIVWPDNTVAGFATNDNLVSDIMSVQSTDGSNPGPNVTAQNVQFSCGSLLDGLSKGAKGMVGFGRTELSLPTQFSLAFRIPRKFALCLSSSSKGGLIVMGDGPYVIQPGIDLSGSLVYTPLYVNPRTTANAIIKGAPSSEYFIAVNSIKINEKRINLNRTLITINKKTGFGGTKISTVEPYTVLESSIYKAFTSVFVNEAKARNITSVAAVSPFGFCFRSKNIVSTRLGAAVPTINLGLQNGVTWSIFGANSVVQVNSEVLCLGFVDGGLEPRTSIVIGGYQLEDNLLQFDIPKSRLGFSSTLLGRQTTCANFNFTKA